MPSSKQLDTNPSKNQSRTQVMSQDFSVVDGNGSKLTNSQEIIIEDNESLTETKFQVIEDAYSQFNKQETRDHIKIILQKILEAGVTQATDDSQPEGYKQQEQVTLNENTLVVSARAPKDGEESILVRALQRLLSYNEHFQSQPNEQSIEKSISQNPEIIIDYEDSVLKSASAQAMIFTKETFDEWPGTFENACFEVEDVNRFQSIEGLASLVLMHSINQVDSESNCFKNLGVEIAPLVDNETSLLDYRTQFVSSSPCVKEQASETKESEKQTDDKKEAQSSSRVTLRFAHTQRMYQTILQKERQDTMIREQQLQEQREMERIEREHREKYAIVDKIRHEMELKENKAKVSVFQDTARRAEEGFLITSMKDLGDTYTGPPKYLSQRDAPLEIPVECVRNLFDVIDTTMDDRISMEEILMYTERLQLPFDQDLVSQMFSEATSGRGSASRKQNESPLTAEEVSAAVRGRHKFNSRSKQWEVSYRSFRDHWIVLLLTVNKRIFALPMPKVIPSKIVAQYEQDQQQVSWMQTTSQMHKTAATSTAGRNQMTVTDMKQSLFQRSLNKTEANLKHDPLSTMRLAERKEKKVEINPYEQQINGRIVKATAGNINLTAISNSQFDQSIESIAPEQKPKVTFDSKELFDQSNQLTQQIPHWKSEQENPVYNYVLKRERPIQSTEEDAEMRRQDNMKARENHLASLHGKDRSLRLAGSMAMSQMKYTPQEKIKERNGFLTAKRVPDIFEDKLTKAKGELNQFDKRTKSYSVVPREYETPKTHDFRNLEIPLFQQDFALRTKLEGMVNPNNLTSFSNKPKYQFDKEQAHMTKYTEAKGLEGKPAWSQYHKLPNQHTGVAQNFKDMYSKQTQEKTNFLEKEEFTTAYLKLARTMKDDLVMGKPALNLYFKPRKASEKHLEFGGTAQNLNSIC